MKLGNYPHAVLHVYKTEGFKNAMAYAGNLSKEELSVKELAECVRAVIKTEGQPHLLDLFERDKNEQADRDRLPAL